MRPRLPVLACCLLLFPSFALAHPLIVGHVSGWIGNKWLDYHDVPCAALDVMVGTGPMLLNIYGSGVRHSGHNFVDYFATEQNYEVGVGIGKILRLGSFHPHVSGGFTRAWTKGRINSDLDNDFNTRFETWGDRGWAGIGGFYELGQGLTLGMAARFSEIGHHDHPQLGGNYLALTLGWQWGLSGR